MSYYLGELPMGLVFAILALGIYISLRILDTPDLTTEGSFGLGVMISCITSVTTSVWLSLPLAMLGGAVAGVVTGVLQTKCKIHPVLSGIITMNLLYSVNLLLVHIGSKNIAGVTSTNIYMGENTIFRKVVSWFNGTVSGDALSVLKAGIVLAVLVVLILALVWFFGTNLGLSIRATGDNADMVRASSIDVDRTKIIALAVSNSLVSLSGAMLAHLQGYADFSSSTGTLIRGLAAVIVGGAIFKLFKKNNILLGLISSSVGALLYQLLVSIVVRYEIFGENSSDLKNFTIAAVMALILAVPSLRSEFKRTLANIKLVKRGNDDA